MKTVRFWKYQGLGNDFVLIDESIAPSLSVEQRVWLCDRNLGVGGDGVLTISFVKDANAHMHITNADGSEAEMCGNGIRCVARWLDDHGKLNGEKHGSILTAAGRILFRLAGQNVEVEMGKARVLSRQAIKNLDTIAVDMGNPHLVVFEKVDIEQAQTLGAWLETNAKIFSRTNVAFLSQRTSSDIDLIVWERGVGLTKACGTAACAAVAALASTDQSVFDRDMRVHLPGGTLVVSVDREMRMKMTGPATKVFEGTAHANI